MCPTIKIGSALILSWYAFLLTGAVVSIALCVTSRPRDFIVSRPSLLGIGIMLFASGFLGGKVLSVSSNAAYHQFQLSCIISPRSGFSYVGALVFSLIAICAYARVSKKSLLALLDYGAPFFLLSQVFVRIGCLMAGCCYGRPTGSLLGATFKLADDALRHPAQGYEAIFLLALYIITRIVYERKRDCPGMTSYLALFLYGAGRFFIEFFRENSAILFMNVSFMQAVYLFLALGSALAMVRMSATISNTIVS